MHAPRSTALRAADGRAGDAGTLMMPGWRSSSLSVSVRLLAWQISLRLQAGRATRLPTSCRCTTVCASMVGAEISLGLATNSNF
jgi:hypothetical protein